MGPSRARVIEQRSQAAAFQRLRRRHPAEVRDRRVEVDQFRDGRGGATGALEARGTDDEGHAGRRLEEGALLPKTVFAEVVAVVAEEDHDRAIRQALLLEFRQDEAELRIHEALGRVVGLDHRSLLPVVHPVVGLGGAEVGLGRAVGPVGRARQAELILRVEVEIALRGYVGRVRAEEAHGQEERLVALLAEERLGLRGDLAVRLLGVRALRGQPRQRRPVVVGAHLDAGGSPGPLARDDREDLVLVVAIATARVPDLLPGTRVIQPVGADLLGYAVVVEFADAGDRVALVLEQLGQGHRVRDVRPELHRVVEDLGRVGAQPREEGRAARVAERVLAVGAIEAHPLGGQFIDVRRQRRPAVAPHGSTAVVGDQQQHVQALRLGREGGDAGEQQGGGGEAHARGLEDGGPEDKMT